jgi:DNA polymerase-3 subunit delta'
MPFRDIVGHKRLVGLLARSVERGSLPPSLIFAGPAGIGKRLAALSTAQALNCLTPESMFDVGGDAGRDACGRCAACTRIARGVHPDVVVVSPGDNGSIKIDAVRDLVERANFRPFEGRRRAVIIDDADALVMAAQNGLLKTLEEPPSASVFILVTSRPDTLLPTVRSRCPQLRFRTLGPDEVAAVLIGRGHNDVEARAVAATADGSIGQALEASAGELVEARDIASRALVSAAVSDDPRRRVDSAKDLVGKTGGSGASDRQQLATHLRALASLLRDVELIGAGGDHAALANADVIPVLERLTAFRGERGIQAFAAVDRGLAALDRNAGVKVVADWVMLNV